MRPRLLDLTPDGADIELGDDPTRVLVAPDGDLTSIDVGALEVLLHHDRGGRPSLTSAWTLTDEDRAAIAAGAPVYLTVMGDSHPPVALRVGGCEL